MPSSNFIPYINSCRSIGVTIPDSTPSTSGIVIADFLPSGANSFGKIISFIITYNSVKSDKMAVRFTYSNNVTETEYFLNQEQELFFLKNDDIIQVTFLYDNSCGFDKGGQISAFFGYDKRGEYAVVGEYTSQGGFSEKVVFTPYYPGIISCYLFRTSENYLTAHITDRLGIRYKYAVSMNDHYSITPYGDLTYYSKGYLRNILPIGCMMEVKVRPRMDVASSVLDFYKIENVLTDRWFPSYNGMTTMMEAFQDISMKNCVKDIEGFNDYPGTYAYHAFYLSQIFDENRMLKTSYIDDYFNSKVIPTERRVGLLCFPTSKPVTEPNITKTDTITVEGQTITVHYEFPEWMKNDLEQVNGYYLFSDGNGYYMYALDWRCVQTRTLYKQCVQTFVNYLSTRQINGKWLWDYIDYVEVGFAGTWGEGIKLCTANYPSTENLIEISDYIINSFQTADTQFRTAHNREKVIRYILSLGTVNNNEFPAGYRDYILNNPHGLFYDGACTVRRYIFIEGNEANQDLSAATNEVMNSAFIHAKTHSSYVECMVEDTSDQLPSYSSLEAYAKYFKPDILSINNIFYGGRNTKLDVNLESTLKRISCYLGTRPYILKNATSVSSEGILKVHISIGNYGTALFATYWKVRLAVIVNDVEAYNEFAQGINLQTIPKAFEPGVPNYYDTKVFELTTSIGRTLQPQDSIDVLISIEDIDGVYQKCLLFCNTTESLPREEDSNNQITGRFYLLKYGQRSINGQP